MTTPIKQKEYKLYKPNRTNYVETSKSLLRGAKYLGEAVLSLVKSSENK